MVGNQIATGGLLGRINQLTSDLADAKGTLYDCAASAEATASQLPEIRHALLSFGVVTQSTLRPRARRLASLL